MMRTGKRSERCIREERIKKKRMRGKEGGGQQKERQMLMPRMPVRK